jgi:U3 small nucleolar RNA-associated protein 10
MTLLKLSLEYMNKNDVNSVLKPFKNLMLKALDFRNLNHNTISLEDIEKFENSCNEAFSVFIPKMSEITFRPLFYKVCVLYSNETTFICF